MLKSDNLYFVSDGLLDPGVSLGSTVVGRGLKAALFQKARRRSFPSWHEEQREGAAVFRRCPSVWGARGSSEVRKPWGAAGVMGSRVWIRRKKKAEQRGKLNSSS